MSDEHDQTPVDSEWLESVGAGFVDGGHYRLGLVWLVRQESGYDLRLGDDGILRQATRGQVRTLCRLLGIALPGDTL